MKVILLQDVAHVGKKHDIKNVASGHALNFLIPRHVAEVATPKAMLRVDALKVKEVVEKKVQADLLLKNLKSLDGVNLEMNVKANAKGHLFAGIHKEEIAKQLLEKGHVSVLPEFIQLEAPLKEVGEHKIKVSVEDKTATMTLTIKAL